MKTVIQINELLLSFEKKYGYKVAGAEQGSEAWFKAKLGVLSASNASPIVAKKDSATRHTYMCSLIAQIMTGEHKEISTTQMEWGTQNEDSARAYYEMVTKYTITPLPFVFLDDNFRVGCSPDFFVTDNRGGEIKCPYDSTNHVRALLDESVKSQWDWQIEFQMYVTGAEIWDFCSYDPRNQFKPFSKITIERDAKRQATLADAVPQFIADLDILLKQLGVEFGSQWTRLAKHPVSAQAGVDLGGSYHG